jgi:hypothetical protein
MPWIPAAFEIKRAIVHHRGSAVMMPVDDRKRVLLVRQYRLPAAALLVGAARRLGGSRREAAPNRQARAEGGDRLPRQELEKAGDISSQPRLPHREDDHFLATGLTAGVATPMDDERIERAGSPAKEIDPRNPSAVPTTTSTAPSRSTNRNTCALRAPSAMRIPISLRLRATAYAVTPASPIAANTRPNTADSAIHVERSA